MEIDQRREYLRNSDGHVICLCGCQKTFKTGDHVLWAFVNSSDSPTELKLQSNKMNFGVYHAECLEAVGTGKTINSLEGRQADLLELSKSDPTELQRLYTWMHDALRCRI